MKSLTISDVSAILHASPDTIRRKVREGKIPMAKHGKEYIVLDIHFAEITHGSKPLSDTLLKPNTKQITKKTSASLFG